MAEYIYGGFEKSGHQEPGGDAHMWWRKIDDLPDQANRDRVRQVINDDAESYKRLGYRVEGPTWSDDNNEVELWVRFKQSPNSSDVALLGGSMAATLARAAWGGPG